VRQIHIKTRNKQLSTGHTSTTIAGVRRYSWQTSISSMFTKEVLWSSQYVMLLHGDTVNRPS